MGSKFSKNCRSSSKKICADRKQGQFHSLLDIINNYIREDRGGASHEMNFFNSRPNLRSAIEYAALSKLPNNNRHPHQYRRSEETLAEAESRLQAGASELRNCPSFEALHALVRREIGPIPDIGPLTVYDVANRIGAHLNLEPERIYLHAGTADGARALGLNCRQESLGRDELPAEFRRLTPREIEDCLCLYKDVFAYVGP